LRTDSLRYGLRDRCDHTRQLTVGSPHASITAKSLCAGVSMLRRAICWMMIAMTPVAMFATDVDSGAAMLYGKGTVWLNGKLLPRSSAVFPGDLIQTEAQSIATLDASGSSVIVFPDSRVKFGKNAVVLESGSFSVATSQGMVGAAREVTATPASNTWTKFEVAETEETVRVFASTSSVNVNCVKGTETLSQGEELTVDKSGNCIRKKRKAGTPLPGDGSILTNPFVLGSAVVGGGVIICLLLCNASEPFLSQWKP
jgi:hypothetical protein